MLSKYYNVILYNLKTELSNAAKSLKTDECPILKRKITVSGEVKTVGETLINFLQSSEALTRISDDCRRIENVFDWAKEYGDTQQHTLDELALKFPVIDDSDEVFSEYVFDSKKIYLYFMLRRENTYSRAETLMDGRRRRLSLVTIPIAEVSYS